MRLSLGAAALRCLPVFPAIRGHSPGKWLQPAAREAGAGVGEHVARPQPLFPVPGARLRSSSRHRSDFPLFEICLLYPRIPSQLPPAPPHTHTPTASAPLLSSGAPILAPSPNSLAFGSRAHRRVEHALSRDTEPGLSSAEQSSRPWRHTVALNLTSTSGKRVRLPLGH